MSSYVGPPVEQRDTLTARAAAAWRREREQYEAAHPPRAPSPNLVLLPETGPDPAYELPVEPQDADAKPVAELPVVSAASFADKPAPPRPWHVPEWIPGRTVTLLNGDGGVGKTILALQLAVATVAGTPWLYLTPELGSVLYLSAEDDRDELHRRLDAIAVSCGAELAELGDLHLIPLAGLDAVLAAPGARAGVIVETAVWRGLVALVEKVRPRLVIIDTSADAYAGDENKRPEVRQFVGLLRSLAIRHDLAVLLLAHPSQAGLSSGSGTSGSTAWNNSVRSRLYFETIKTPAGEEVDANVRALGVKKSNYGPGDKKLRLRWSRGTFIIDGPESGFDKLAVHAEADRAFLDMLALFETQGRDVSPNPSKTYAPAVFAELPEAAGLGNKALEGAMNRLLKAERIRIDKYGPTSRPRSRLILAPVKNDGP